MESNEKVSYQIDITGNAAEELKKIKDVWKEFNDNAKTPSNSSSPVNNTNTNDVIPKPSSFGKPQLSESAQEAIKLRKEFRQTNLEMFNLMHNGEKSSAAFINMAKSAGELRDEMGDTRAYIKYFASDTRQLDSAIEGFKAIAGTAQVATGAMSIFGVSSETATVAIERMVAIESVLNGVKEIQNALQSDSALMLGLTTAKTKVATIVQSVYTATVGASTGALKLFKVALMTTGIGALVVGLGFAISKLIEFKDKQEASNKAVEESKRVNVEANKYINENLKKTIELKEKSKQLDIDLLRAQGKNAEADKLEGLGIQERVDAAKKRRQDIVDELGAMQKSFNLARSNMHNVPGGIENFYNNLKPSFDSQHKKMMSDLTVKTAEYNNLITEKRIQSAKVLAAAQKKSEKDRLKSNSTTLVNKAPDTFNVSIQNLIKIDEQVIENGLDADSFNTMLKNSLVNALSTIQMQRNK